MDIQNTGGLNRPDPRHGVEHVVWDVPLDELPPAGRNDFYATRRGYAVQHSGSHVSGWLFFEAAEPAYVYGRAARMAHGCTNWEIHHAVHDMRFDTDLDRDVSTLYLSDKAPIRGPKEGDHLVATWLSGLTVHNSNWTPPDTSRKAALSEVVDNMEQRYGPVDEALVTEILGRLDR